MLNVDERFTQSARNVQFVENVQNDIVLGVFINGDYVIKNVPYNKHIKSDSTTDDRHRRNNNTTDVSYDLYLNHDVLFQLSHIIKIMQKEEMQTVDYQRFIIENSQLVAKDGYGSSFAVDLTLPDITSEDSVIKIKDENISHMSNVIDIRTKDDKKTKERICKHVVDNWLKNYNVMKSQVETTQPVRIAGLNESENQKKIKEAQAWLDYFHKQLDTLPELERNIIKKKYLEVGRNGHRYPLDVDVSDSLFISTRQYYYRKKEALYLLGIALDDNWNACL